MKSEVLPTYDYDSVNGAASRMSCRMPLYGPHYVQPGPLGVDSGYPYRSNPLSAYPFQQKGYFSAVPPFSDFGEPALDYDIHGSTYQVFGAENLGMTSNYSTSGTPRGWSNTPHLPRNSLFIEQSDTPYSHSQMPYHSGGYPLRTTINTEPRIMSLNGVSLPAPLTTDRMLPMPAKVQAAPFHRSPDNILPSTQNVFQPYQGDYLRSSLKSQNMQAVSENEPLASSYLPMPSSSPESIASSQMTYSSQQVSLSSQQQQQSEMYTPPSTDGSYQAESSDSSYGHTGGSTSGSKRGSHSSQTMNQETSLPPIATDILANGQRYVPYQSETGYPAPPMGNNVARSRVVHQNSITVDN
jgi:hypothetical protein